jgi:hypothetical protein
LSACNAANILVTVLLDRDKPMEVCNDTKRVLAYCKDALDEIRTEQPTGALWERRWASLVTLLRTTCEVLKREAPIFWKKSMEAPNAGSKGRDSKSKWNPEIFGRFIWTDANLFLHQGMVTAGQSKMVFIQGAQAQGLAGGQRPVPLPLQAPALPPVTSYHMNTPAYASRDPREVADEAVIWLEQQIALAET